MEKRAVIGLITVLVMAVSACGTSDEKNNSSKNTVSVDEGEVSLGQYKGLAADQIIYTVTDEDVDNEIMSMLEEYAEYKVVNRAAEDGDYVGFDLKSAVDGKELVDYTGKGFGTHIGYEDFGAEFDEQLLGVIAGEEKEFTIAYGEDYWDEEFAGNTVDYEVKVTSVEEEIHPELTDEFVSGQLGYQNEKELREQVRLQLKEDNRENSEGTLQNELLQQIIDHSTFGKYSEDLYNQCKGEIESEYMGYADLFGCKTVEDVYQIFEMSEEDVTDEILRQVYMHMVVDAIAEKEKITVSDSEFQEGAAAYAADMGYEDSSGLETDYGTDTVRFWLIREKVIDFVQDNAKVTEIETEQPQEADSQSEESKMIK